MRVKTLVRAACATILLVALFVIWYSVANYDNDTLAGTYVFHGNGETCTLQLRPDRSFVQELNRSSGQIQKSEGHWHRYGEAHVSVSGEFLMLSGEEINADGQAHGEFDKTLGIPFLVLAPLPNGPLFHKKLFR